MEGSRLNLNSNGTREIVTKLWNLCHILRDGGITYQAYVTELTYLLFLKMMQETEREAALPKGFRWNDLISREGEDLLTFYRTLLLKLGTETKGIVREIFADAQTGLKRPTDLKELVTQINRLDWFSAKQDGLGDLYEGLLERNANEKKSGAGQYFTPRPLIDCMVRVLRPEPGEIVQDPAAGTGGFLIAADRFIKERTDDLFALKASEQRFQREDAFRGLELVPDTHRMLLMNLMLHDIGGSHVLGGDALSPAGEALGKADLILTNPPFGTKKGGGRPTRTDFSITADSSNKQLAFIEHVVRALRPGGRAGVVVPDNVLSGEVGHELRSWLMELCDVHTILRLPLGLFYAQAVRTNVVFFSRGQSEKRNTSTVWVYDLRAGQPAYGKKRPFSAADLAEFVKCYGDDPLGKAARSDLGIDGRFKAFSRDEIARLGDELHLTWLRSNDEEAEYSLEEPEDIAEAMLEHLNQATTEIEKLAASIREMPLELLDEH